MGLLDGLYMTNNAVQYTGGLLDHCAAEVSTLLSLQVSEISSPIQAVSTPLTWGRLDSNTCIDGDDT